MMKKVILGVIAKQLRNNAVTGHRQHGFLRRRSCLINLISFYNKITQLVDKEKPADVVVLYSNKAFDVVPFQTKYPTYK